MTTIDTTRQIKILALCQLILFVPGLALSFVLESQLPPLLEEYAQRQYQQEATLVEIIFLTLSAVVFLIYLASLFGFILNRKWAKSIYVGCTILFVLLALGTGPYVEHAFSAALD